MYKERIGRISGKVWRCGGIAREERLFCEKNLRALAYIGKFV